MNFKVINKFIMFNSFKDFVFREGLDIPPEPGTKPIPSGHVRLYHQTDPNNVDSIKRYGLSTKYSRGKDLKEPNVIWASKDPYYGKIGVGDYATIEFHVPEEQFRSPMYVIGEVPPTNITAVYMNWYDVFKGLVEENPKNSEIRSLLDMGGKWGEAAKAYLQYKGG